jgi:hypothetical protein
VDTHASTLVGSIVTIEASQFRGSSVDIYASTLVGVLLFLFFQNFNFVRNPMLIVVNIAANDCRYSVQVFANASKRLDIHQHTVLVQVTARQLVQFVPHREHPV